MSYIMKYENDSRNDKKRCLRLCMKSRNKSKEHVGCEYQEKKPRDNLLMVKRKLKTMNSPPFTELNFTLIHHSQSDVRHELASLVWISSQGRLRLMRLNLLKSWNCMRMDQTSEGRWLVSHVR